jgi:hypothetical protein
MSVIMYSDKEQPRTQHLIQVTVRPYMGLLLWNEGCCCICRCLTPIFFKDMPLKPIRSNESSTISLSTLTPIGTANDLGFSLCVQKLKNEGAHKVALTVSFDSEYRRWEKETGIQLCWSSTCLRSPLDPLWISPRRPRRWRRL